MAIPYTELLITACPGYKKRQKPDEGEWLLACSAAGASLPRFRKTRGDKHLSYLLKQPPQLSRCLAS